MDNSLKQEVKLKEKKIKKPKIELIIQEDVLPAKEESIVQTTLKPKNKTIKKRMIVKI